MKVIFLFSPLVLTQTEYGIKESALHVLRVLARLKAAYRPEIASLAGLSKSQTRNLLKQLQTKGLVERKQIGKYEGWEIRTKGLRLAHRSWNIPKGVHFAQYRREFRYAGERHRRVSRRWRAWLKTAYPRIEIWESWTELPMFDGIPDALAWGYTGKHEILFWLEVDSGHSSRRVMERNYFRRLQNAIRHIEKLGIPIVFCIMGPPWVVEFFPVCIPTLPPYLAVIGQDWRAFGDLPVYEFQMWNSGIQGRKKPHLKTSFLSTQINIHPNRKGREHPNDQNPNPQSPGIPMGMIMPTGGIGVARKGRNDALMKVA